MIQKLRRKLVCVIMAIVTLLLCLIFCTVYQAARLSLEREIVNQMQLAAADAGELTGPRFAVWAAEGFAPFLEEYRALCINLGRPVKFEGGQGVAEQVDEEGRLIVRTEAGEQKVFTGEVSVKGVYEDIERTERTPR